MAIKLELIGTPPQIPGPGKVIIHVRISGLEWFSQADLNQKCERFGYDVVWNFRHEPRFVLHVPLMLSEDAATRVCSAFYEYHVKTTTGLSCIISSVDVVPHYHAVCYYECGASGDWDEDDRPGDWKLVTGVGCKRALGSACPSCAQKKTCNEQCKPPCHHCQKFPPPTPSPSDTNEGN